METYEDLLTKKIDNLIVSFIDDLQAEYNITINLNGFNWDFNKEE